MNKEEIKKHVDYQIELVQKLISTTKDLDEKDPKQLTLSFSAKGFAGLSMFYLIRLKAFLEKTTDYKIDIPDELQDFTKNYKEQFTLSSSGKLLYEGEDFEVIKEVSKNANTKDKV